LPVSDCAELLLADTPESFAAAVVKVLQDSDLANELAQRGANLVRAEFGWQKVAERFANICEGALMASQPSSGLKVWNRIQPLTDF